MSKPDISEREYLFGEAGVYLGVVGGIFVGFLAAHFPWGWFLDIGIALIAVSSGVSTLEEAKRK